MCEEPTADRTKIEEMTDCIRSLNPSAKIVRTVFRPKPLEDIRNEKVLLTTTAPPAVAGTIRNSLEEAYGCEVVAISHHLSNRPKLRSDIQDALRSAGPTVLLTELKAAAIDVATAMGLEAGLRVVYADNALLGTEGEPDLAEQVVRLAQTASERFDKRNHNEENQ
jgi:cyclic 2,3-diphosphoglycerate synthetase